MDSKGNNLSIKQIEYFDRSKVRDKNGRLRPVYPNSYVYSAGTNPFCPGTTTPSTGA